MRRVIDLIFQTQFCRTDILKKSVTNMGAKLYNKLPNYIKNVENLKPFKNQLKTFLLQQTFYSVDKYLAYNQGKTSSLYYPNPWDEECDRLIIIIIMIIMMMMMMMMVMMIIIIIIIILDIKPHQPTVRGRAIFRM